MSFGSSSTRFAPATTASSGSAPAFIRASASSAALSPLDEPTTTGFWPPPPPVAVVPPAPATKGASAAEERNIRRETKWKLLGLARNDAGPHREQVAHDGPVGGGRCR